MNKDFSYTSGERQTASSVQEIRYDHLARYQLVIDFLKDKQLNFGLDLFCGNGYGSYLMSSELNSAILGIDGSSEAIDFANSHYATKQNMFSYKQFPFLLPKQTFDFAVCFESLEHVEDDVALAGILIESLVKNGYLFVSVPNQEIHDLAKNPHKFHFRHYVNHDVINFFKDFELIKRWGQNVYEFDKDGYCLGKLLDKIHMKPVENTDGQVNMYLFRKKIKKWHSFDWLSRW